MGASRACAPQRLPCLDRGAELIAALDRKAGPTGELRCEAIGLGGQWAIAAVGVARATDHQQLRLELLQQPFYGAPIDASGGGGNRAVRGGRSGDGVAGGNADTFLTEVEAEDEPRGGLRHVPP